MKRQLEAQIKYIDNSPKLFINGENTLPVFYGLSDIPGAGSNTYQAWKNIRNFSKKGINIVCCDTGLHIGWRKSAPYDAEPVIEEVNGVLDANPDAGVIIRLHLNPPYWWLRDNPDELIKYQQPDGSIHGGTDNGEQDRLLRFDADENIRVSFGSEKWKKEAGELLIATLNALQACDAGDRIIGIQVAYGLYGEWHNFGVDVSAPMKRKFKAYLRKKYGSDENLQVAWNDESVTLETAEYCPHFAQKADDGFFRDPQKSMKIIDAQKCAQIVTAQNIVYFCKLVKESWKRHILAGAFYGYYLGATGITGTNTGHLMPQIIFENKKYVDFICGPFPYYKQNRSAYGVPLQRGLLESCRLNGVLWLTEMDQHPEGTEWKAGGLDEFYDETHSLLFRNTFQPLLSGMGYWYYDHRIIPQFIDPKSSNTSAGSIYRKVGWWDTPELMDDIGKIYDIATKYCLDGYKPSGDVLMVLDTDSHFYKKYNEAEYEFFDAWMRTGVAIEYIYLSDLNKVDFGRYKCIILANAYKLDKSQREVVKTIPKNVLIAIFYGTGYCDGETLSVAGIKDVTGIKTEKAENINYYYDGITNEKVSSEKLHPNPCFYVSDNEVEIFGRYENGTCAVAKKENVIYFAYPLLNLQLAEKAIELSGAHRYCKQGDVVLADNNLVLLNAFYKGEKEIFLKNGKKVAFHIDGVSSVLIDATTGKIVLKSNG